MSTVAIIGAAFEALRGQLTAAQVKVRIGAKVITGLLPEDSATAKGTMLGLEPGFNSGLWLLKSEIPNPPGLNDGDVLEVQYGNEWRKYRAQGLAVHGGAVVNTTLVSENQL